jgi:adenylate cyclase
VLEERGIPLTLGFSINAGQPALPRVEPVNRLPHRPAPPASPAPAVRPASTSGDAFEEFVETQEAPPLEPEEVARALALPVRASGLALPSLEQRSSDG